MWAKVCGIQVGKSLRKVGKEHLGKGIGEGIPMGFNSCHLINILSLCRCCTSVMRRSIPLTAYPPEQLVETFSRDSRSRRSGGRTIDNALLAQIVEESRTARKR
jgi:hypothetical protein